ncbi:MAG TPA: 50S ribosomal protein L2 [Candidatus Saccharimonadales bacterium]|nr:50S ribosomal protein L2 [Candidatus Saccharimonadales bacterium]
MGKPLKQQRRGKGSNAYTKPPLAQKAEIAFRNERLNKKLIGEVIDFIDDPGHSAPLMLVRHDDFTESKFFAPEGIKIGDRIQEGAGAEHTLGSILTLSEIPDGMPVYNIESKPGDGGKFARGAGAYATIIAHTGNTVTVSLPSKSVIELESGCRAAIGAVSGGGQSTKPIMKAGKNFYIKHALNKRWPLNRGVKMNPVDHPFGGKQHHKGASSMTSRNAPPGRKVGHIAASRVGRKKRG